MATKIKKGLIYAFLIIAAIVCGIPFLLMVINSTRSGVEISSSFTLIPGTNLIENWKLMSDYFNLFKGMLNSLIVAIPATICAIYFSALTAYGLAFYKFKANKVVFISILVFMMIPGQLSMIGFYQLCSKLHLINSYIPLIIPMIASPGTVFFLKQYTESDLNPEILDSARIDGASEIRTFHTIVIPIIMPGIATMGIMSFIGTWNNYLMPMILLTDKNKFTLPVMMSTLRAARDLQQNQGAIYLSVAISVIPILLVFVFFSKYIISSISAGSLKG
ncbi:MAG: carbohydrate ABC transporter permease [Eubacterium sp.]|nr:carbohydrate ABC transporter permease [Eubacterium sp.]